MGRGRHRGRSQRKHFKESRENVWKRPRTDPTVDASDNAVADKPSWEPILTDNPNFEEYYKVITHTRGSVMNLDSSFLNSFNLL